MEDTNRCLKLLFTAGLVLCASLRLFGQVPSPIPFEIDGDATSEAVGTQDDWNNLNVVGGTFGGANILTGCSGSYYNGSDCKTHDFAPGTVPDLFTIGSKDPSGASAWRWTSGSAPDKDTFNDVYVAAYRGTTTGNHLVLYAGSDRNSNNGDSNVGIWLFQGNVQKQAGGTFGPDSQQNGDVFVVAAFTGGGGVPGVSVYEWDTSCTAASKSQIVGNCFAANLRIKFLGAAGTSCSSTGAKACADVNSGTISFAWPYTSKGGSTSSSVAAGLFFEAGIDLTSVSPANCFGSFLLETRSSQSATAELKNFHGGQLNLCGHLTSTKQCDPTIAPAVTPGSNGTTIDYFFIGTVTDDGQGPEFGVTLNDQASNSNGTPTAGSTTHPGLFTCDATNHPTTTAITDMQAGDVGCFALKVTTSDLSVTNSVTPRGSTGPGGTVENGTSATTNPACAFTPLNTLDLEKQCGSDVNSLGTSIDTSSGLRVRVDFSGTVTNKGTSQLTKMTLADATASSPTPSSTSIDAIYTDPNNQAGTAVSQPFTLNPTGGAATCPSAPCEVFYKGHYFAGAADVTQIVSGTANGRYSFNDTASITGAQAALGTAPSCSGTPGCPTGGNAVAVPKPGPCLLCPSGTCP